MTRTNLITVLLVLLYAFVYAQKGNRNQHLEIIPVKTLTKTAVKEKEYPSSLHSISYSTSASSVEEIAMQYLKEQGNLLGINNVENTLLHKKTRRMPSGYRVRFKQVYKGYPVYKSSVVVSINNNNEVVFVANSYKAGVRNSQQVVVSESEAIQISKDHLSISTAVKHLKTDLQIFYINGISKLVRKINFIPQSKNVGDWEFLIDAETGEIVQAKDQVLYLGVQQETRGKVFDPDPITSADANYGDSGFEDSDDADSPQVKEQLVEKELPNLWFQDGIYRLRNEYASIVDFELPYTGLHEQDSANFFFTRSDDGFEAVNAFYHIDQSMRYINDTLGLDLMPYQYAGGVRFDPHGRSGEDNSGYFASSGYLSFGDGGVDDAEDQDVIVHELGHGIHDWITDGGLSQVDGLSEGSGDYWAQSYKRAKGFIDNTSAKYDWLFSWDGHNEFWSGRRTDHNAKYPSGLVDQIHDDGQIWGTALMKVYDLIGRQATDNNFLNALSMLNENSSQRDAAFAFVQADIDNYGGAHLQQIGEVFTNTGYIENPISLYVTADVTGGPANLTVNFSDIIDSHSSWQWDFNNDGVVDSDERSPSFTYTEAGLYTVNLSVFDGMQTISDSLVDFISVNEGIFVWEGLKNGPDNSGSFIYEFLDKNNVAAVYSRSGKIPSSFIGYDAVFLSFGAGTNSVSFNGSMLLAVVQYLQNGGNLYIEGADAISPHADNDGFLDLLGLSFVEDGKRSKTYVTNLAGQSASIFKGLVFSESFQEELGSIDKYHVNDEGIVAFVESDYGNVGVQSTGTFGQKTILFSYALAELVDERIPNTRDDILINILDFMDIALPLVPRFSVDIYSGHMPFTANFSNYSIFDKTDSGLSWHWDFENDGIYDSQDEMPTHVYENPGLYDVKLTAAKDQDSITAIIPEFIRVFDGESALLFDDTENYIQIDPVAELNLTDQYTIEFWMYPTDWGTSVNGFGRIFDKGTIQVYLRKTLAGNYNPHSMVIYMRHDGGKTSSYATPDSSIKLEEWQHVAISYQGSTSTLQVYINGESAFLDVVSREADGPVLNNENTNLILAESLIKTRPYMGKLDEIRLWNVARSPFRIQTHWYRYVEADQQGLVAYWQFNEAFGDTLKDLTPNAINGIILKPTWVDGKPDILATGVQEKINKPVKDFKLYTNFPNPFNPETKIKFQIPERASISLKIYDILGREIKTLLQSKLNSGVHSYQWNGTNALNQRVASGIYFYILEVKAAAGVHFKDQKKMILIH